ncbi:hypothetical protein [Rhodovibrio salinarum]|uniref:Uncharacterized protein n=1 Tax=Rhodovibrio salinarum TaxID=1087 RepID=A0A934UYW0_9PROT|nr:hypothetical protein [Rhodovibrio salinarum]MBK1695740.1 hypothetical protein [Rhodovibrio salinarum]
MSYLLYAPKPFCFGEKVREIAARRGRAVHTVRSSDNLFRKLDADYAKVLLISPEGLRQAPIGFSEVLTRISDNLIVVVFVDPGQLQAPGAPDLDFAAAILTTTDAVEHVAWILERLFDQPMLAAGEVATGHLQQNSILAPEGLDDSLSSDPIDDQLMALELARKQTAAGVPTAALRLSAYRDTYPVTYISAGIRDITGLLPHTLIGRSLYSLADSARTPGAEIGRLRDALEQRRAVAVTLAMAEDNRQPTSVRLQMRPYYSTWGILQSFVGLLWARQGNSDVTDMVGGSWWGTSCACASNDR